MITRGRRRTIRSSALVGLVVSMTVAIAGCTPAGEPVADPAPVACPADQVVPDDGTLFGVNLDWEAQSLAEYASVIGERPAVAGAYSRLPLTDGDPPNIRLIAEQVRDANAALLLTLEPREGLAAVTEESIDELAELLAEVTGSGVPVIVRYAHQMNGSWYPWAQQPTEYIASFRLVAETLEEAVPDVTMMWAPNYGGEYPFVGGEFERTSGMPQFDLLDTDGDGRLSMSDDPYAPYYPGDDVVDWVGLSLYHWGAVYPWGENEVAEPGKFAAQLSGEYDGIGGDESALPDFSALAAEAGKPLAIPETAAFVTADAPPALALEIKSSWWSQVLSEETAARFPHLAMINWFEWSKYEAEVDDDVDWTIAGDPTIASAFAAALPEGLQFAPDEAPCTEPAS